jgi:hypothetical protein
MALLSFLKGLFSKKNQKQELKTPEVPIFPTPEPVVAYQEAIEPEIKSEAKKPKKKAQPKATKQAATKQVKAKKQPTQNSKK